ncbi:MAG TPA: ferritin family protein [Atribacteraceae bacterium]|nr:ferritin family protein [Atribacteraceae bacterium]
MKFSAAELLEMAMELEKKGMDFYRNLSKQVFGTQTRDIFLFLHDEEERHLSYFSEMYETLDRKPVVFDTMNEAIEYLGAIIENGVLGKVLKGVDLTGGDGGVGRALDIGMDVEKESVIFYQAMEPMIPHQKRDLLRSIIQEEKKHYLRLSGIKQDLATKA